jgi:hypothetical protein
MASFFDMVWIGLDCSVGMLSLLIKAAGANHWGQDSHWIAIGSLGLTPCKDWSMLSSFGLMDLLLSACH